VSRVVYEKFFRVGVLPAGASPLLDAHLPPHPLCVTGPWRGDCEYHSDPEFPGAGAAGACRHCQGSCGYGCLLWSALS
jgi:hypothetical protein